MRTLVVSGKIGTFPTDPVPHVSTTVHVAPAQNVTAYYGPLSATPGREQARTVHDSTLAASPPMWDAYDYAVHLHNLASNRED